MEASKNEIDNCIRCGKNKGYKGLKNVSFKYCKECARILADEQYLDDGSGQVIRENADRPKQVRVDLNEQESELDKMLEEY